MEGLDVREIRLSDVLADEDLRLEGKYYNTNNLHVNCAKGDIIESFSQYGTSKELNEDNDGYSVLRMNEFDTFFISKPAKNCNLLDADTYESLRLRKDDVLICRTNGNPKLVGRAAIVPRDYDFAFASYLFRVRTNPNLINASTLVSFLNSKYGRLEIEKFSMISNQANFSPAKFRKISIPLFSKQFNIHIEALIYQAFALLERSKVQYSEAEDILLQELGLKSWQPDDNPINIKQLKDSFLKSGRLDAEYYQQKYEDYTCLLEEYKDGFSKLSNVCNISDKNFNPADDTEYKYIELSNIGNSGEITGCTVAKGSELPSRARRLVHSNDVIVSSIEGSLSSCALITEEFNGALCSTGFYVIHSSFFNPETLLLIFKSEPIQMLMKKGCSGTILTAISKNELEKIPLPLIQKDIQKQLAPMIQKSYRLRNESKHLLEIAKKAVEIAISENEERAILFIKENEHGKSLYH